MDEMKYMKPRHTITKEILSKLIAKEITMTEAKLRLPKHVMQGLKQINHKEHEFKRKHKSSMFSRISERSEGSEATNFGVFQNEELASPD